MYIIEYFKTNGDVVTLQVSTAKELQDLVICATTSMIKGYIISFNAEVIS